MFFNVQLITPRPFTVLRSQTLLLTAQVLHQHQTSLRKHAEVEAAAYPAAFFSLETIRPDPDFHMKLFFHMWGKPCPPPRHGEHLSHSLPAGVRLLCAEARRSLFLPQERHSVDKRLLLCPKDAKVAMYRSRVLSMEVWEANRIPAVSLTERRTAVSSKRS